MVITSVNLPVVSMHRPTFFGSAHPVLIWAPSSFWKN